MASHSQRRKLDHSLRLPEIAQLKVLGHLQQRLKGTERIAPMNWSDGSNYADFARKIPCSYYEDLEPMIHSQMNNAKNILSAEPVKFYERTSGSSGAAKFIPYTKSYLKILNTLFLLWVDDLLNSALVFRSAKTFVCVSPPLHGPVPDGQSQIGSNTDVDYIAPWLRPLLKRFLAVPLALHTEHDPLVYRDLLCLYLIAADDLEIISLWSPSLWFAMQEHFLAHRQRLSTHLRQGSYSSSSRRWRFKRLSQARAHLLQAQDIVWQELWPSLVFISCWNQGHAKAGAEQLSQIFPKAFLQGKGLLATEAPVSLPLLSAKVSVPYLTELFLEGEDLADQNIYPLWQWQGGHSYKLIVSLPNGILRYYLGDIVAVTGFYHKTPIFEFMGRDTPVMDLVGEKLSELFVQKAVDSLTPKLTGNWALFPMQHIKQSGYIMLIDSFQEADYSPVLDEFLAASHHYRLARNLGQLAAVTIVYSPNWTLRYLTLAAERGQQLGNVKHAFLQKRIFSETEIRYLRGLAT